jgi:S-adenosylmethionine:tRNA ribosyltransferase-isomerase
LTDDLALYDYKLPDELIARHPAVRREDARLMIIDRAAGTVQHRRVDDLPDLLQPDDCLVLNNTRVVPARLLGKRVQSGGRWEGLFLESTPTGDWRILSQCRGKLRSGEYIEVHPVHDLQSSHRLLLQLGQRDEDGIWIVRPEHGLGHPPSDTWAVLDKFGSVPLPPYLRRELAEQDDFARYQTVYAQHPGSVAAPTAGLHFTRELLTRCGDRGIGQAFVTLHVGIGTFRPISVDRLDAHRMHSEWCEVGAECIQRMTQARERGARRIAVGTTTARALESAAREGLLAARRGSTDLFIRPPFKFRAIDGLLTNFHLPRSTLLVLVCTFAGRDLIIQAYAEAIREKYRFFSYGDAMLIL